MSSKYIIVWEFNSSVDAEIAQGLLEENGIRSQITKDDAGGMRPHMQFSFGVQLSVPFEQLSQAEEVLKLGIKAKSKDASKGKLTDSQWTCPKCGEMHDEQFTSCWNCGNPREIQ